VILIHSAVWFHHAHWASMLQLLLDHLFRLSGTTNQVTWSSAHLSLLFSLEKLGPISCGALGFLDVPRKLCCCLIWLNQMECYFCVLIYLLHLKINREYGYGIYDFSLLVRTDEQKARYTRLDDVGSIVEEMLVEDGCSSPELECTLVKETFELEKQDIEQLMIA